jgi:hypothetical protein
MARAITNIKYYPYEPRTLNGKGNFMIMPPETDLLVVLKRAKQYRCRIVVKTRAMAGHTGQYYLKFPEHGTVSDTTPQLIQQQFENADRIRRMVWFIQYE